MNTLPKVSVIVPAYNVSHYLETTLLSLERQSYDRFEVLIVDDGSTDDTAKIATVFCQRDSRFRLLQKPNGGLSSARNYGINHAVGKYIALLDGDDVYHPDKLNTHVEVLENSEEIGVAYSASRAIRNDGKETWMILNGKPVQSDPLIALLCKNFIGHGSNAVFRRCLIDTVGGFDETLSSCEDVDFWLRIAATKRWQFYRLPQILCYYRVRPSGLSFKIAQMHHNQQRVIEGAYQRSPEMIAPWITTARAYMYRYLARVSFTSGDRDLARHYLDQAWLENGSIFFRDWRSLTTLIAVTISPLANLAIRQTLGTVKQ